MKADPKKISIVVPLMNEEENLEHLHAEIRKAIVECPYRFEILFVDDGSTDRSWQVIQKLSAGDSSVRGLRFSRNRGHQPALFAGLEAAKGDAVISMDADLQHPPRVILELIAKWEEGYGIVNTVRRDSEDTSYFKKTTSRLFYRVFSFLSGVRMSEGMADFRLLDKAAAIALVSHREQKLFLRGLVQTIGFSEAILEFDCGVRFKGVSKYSLRKMIQLAWTGISSFSMVPLRLAVWVGAFTGGLAFLALVYGLFIKLFTDTSIPGWASVICIVSLLFGVMFILMGIIGEYLGRILVEVRERPRYIVSERVGE